MSTTMMLAGNLTDDPELLHGRDGKQSVCYRVAVSRPIQNAVGERVDDVPTGHSVTVYDNTANLFYNSANRGDRVVVHGQLRSEGWRKRETGEKRTKQGVTVEDRFGEVDLSLKYGATRPEQIAPAVPTEI